MNNNTRINATNFVVAGSKDGRTKGVEFSNNLEVEYLPYKIFMQFPKLLELRAFQCSIKQITKHNFEQLIELEKIVLHGNQIQEISVDTFKGIVNLILIDLSEFEVSTYFN